MQHLPKKFSGQNQKSFQPIRTTNCLEQLTQSRSMYQQLLIIHNFGHVFFHHPRSPSTRCGRQCGRLHVVSEDAEGHRSALGVQLLPEDTTKLPRLWREKWRKTRGDLDETMDVLFSTKFSSWHCRMFRSILGPWASKLALEVATYEGVRCVIRQRFHVPFTSSLSITSHIQVWFFRPWYVWFSHPNTLWWTNIAMENGHL